MARPSIDSITDGFLNVHIPPIKCDVAIDRFPITMKTQETETETD